MGVWKYRLNRMKFIAAWTMVAMFLTMKADTVFEADVRNVFYPSMFLLMFLLIRMRCNDVGMTTRTFLLLLAATFAPPPAGWIPLTYLILRKGQGRDEAVED